MVCATVFQRGAGPTEPRPRNPIAHLPIRILFTEYAPYQWWSRSVAAPLANTRARPLARNAAIRIHASHGFAVSGYTFGAATRGGRPPGRFAPWPPGSTSGYGPPCSGLSVRGSSPRLLWCSARFTGGDAAAQRPYLILGLKTERSCPDRKLFELADV